MPERELRSWLGRHESDLMASWGAPARIETDGNGGRVLVYSVGDTRPEESVNVHPPADTLRTRVEPRPSDEERRFWVSREGFIYAWRW